MTSPALGQAKAETPALHLSETAAALCLGAAPSGPLPSTRSHSCVQPLTFKGLTSLRSVCCIYQVSQRSASLIFNLFFFPVCVIRLHFSQFCCPRAMSDRYPALNKNLKMYQRLPHPYYTHINTYKG